jgi:hypothetical protein
MDDEYERIDNLNQSSFRILQIAAVIVIAGGLVIYTAFDTINDAGRLRSLVGMVALVLISFLISKHRTKVSNMQVICLKLSLISKPS